MNASETKIPAVKLISPRRVVDSRGHFSAIYSKASFSSISGHEQFVQDNCSFSEAAGTIRGLHFQLPPMAQAKLVMVLRGRVLDVAVDCRRGSPTYGEHVSAELSAEDWNQLYIPTGFAHGFCTLEPDTLVFYKVSAPYSPELDGGILWHDPDLRIDWPTSPDRAIVSEKDRRLPRISELGEHFRYGEC
jgi:dTDP-4-dehydrorhamnose 3,5-epimerase